MRRLGPEEDGRRFHGHTAWNINWRYTSQPWGNACGATRVEVTAVIVITLPRWDPPPQAPDELRHRWDVYLTALREHEEGHRDLAVAAARRVHSRLSGFRTGDCRTFSREANAEGRYILDRLRADNRRYDEETGHGRTQGAVWRPG
jgi:predicted secreted Zn-dependent protease